MRVTFISYDKTLNLRKGENWQGNLLAGINNDYEKTNPQDNRDKVFRDLPLFFDYPSFPLIAK